MGRLIDADAFIEDIKTEIVNLALDGLKGTPRDRDELYQIIDRINEQPTAYDVEKVMEELEENQKIVFRFDGRKPIQSIDYEDAIDIVKRGGVE